MGPPLSASHLAVREGRDVVYIARFQGSTSLISGMVVGSRLPAHATAPGRVLLTGLPMPDLMALYDGYDFETYTAHTPASMSALVSLVERDRKDRSVVSWGFYEPDVASVAAPLFNPEGKLDAVISVSCPLSVYKKDAFTKLVRSQVENAASEISRSRGFRTAVPA